MQSRHYAYAAPPQPPPYPGTAYPTHPASGYPQSPPYPAAAYPPPPPQVVYAYPPPAPQHTHVVYVRETPSRPDVIVVNQSRRRRSSDHMAEGCLAGCLAGTCAALAACLCCCFLMEASNGF